MKLERNVVASTALAEQALHLTENERCPRGNDGKYLSNLTKYEDNRSERIRAITYVMVRGDMYEALAARYGLLDAA